MKLLVCRRCGDVLKLVKDADRICLCGESKGRCLRDGSAQIWGPAVGLGIDNNSLAFAIRTRTAGHKGPRVEAFVFPEDHPRFRREDG